MTKLPSNQGDAIDRSHPDRVAVVESRGDGSRTEVSFAELDARADAMADRLLRAGHPRGATVVLLGENSADWLASFLGIQRAGLVPAPISYKFPPETRAAVLDNADPVLVLVDTAERAAGIAAPVLSFSEAVAPVTGDQLPHPETTGSDPAMILYTSGSTGVPKGVVLSQASHLWVLGVGFDPSPTPQITLVAAPLYHMNALANCQASLLRGDTVVLMDRFDAGRFADLIASEQVTNVTGVPPMLALVLQEQQRRTPDQRADFSSVTATYIGSAPASDDLLDQIEAAFPRSRMKLSYGTTESGPVAFSHDPQRRSPRGSVGLAHPAVDIRLVGPDGEPANPGVMEIRTGALLTGYHRRDDVPMPLTGDGFYHTKDVFRRDEDGYYFFEGRVDDMFTSGGENVYPRLVEQVIEDHPDVNEAAVVPVEDPVKGNRPVAFVVPAPGRRVDEAAVKAYTLEHLEPYAHPRRIFVVESLPLSSSNKVDRHALTARAKGLL
ncbi:class I adenylate-forming enzyme family protein [Parenemella sanctibonifatiensis]|uniref:Acetyl-CoA synthetase n=1 Tax=Parenemella sanctibonifatiensis TaxID=2016505 RepID=A0A255EHV4_9ACTN|nr:class I adenylate-forming enzyme family protein [Parenemella sanctibonifatiensis]OYN91104.1 acetyl-CoA synthetase [Parenemella sanctibonifatiensis]